MDARRFPPPPPPRQQNNNAGVNANIKEEQTPIKKEKKKMSKELKMALLLCGATASFLVAIVCIVLLFVL